MLKIVPLDKKYSHENFDCGVPVLNNYLKTQASQDIRNYHTALFIALKDSADDIAGFYTLSNAGVSLDKILGDAQKRLSKYPSVPAIRLSRLAVDKLAQGRGVGKAMLADVILRSLNLSGWAVMVVDVKNEQAAAFYKRYGFAAVDSDELSLVILRSALIKRHL